MNKLLREAWFFTRHHLKPLLAIALVYTLPSTLLELGASQSEQPFSDPLGMLIAALLICLGVVQFGAAMLFIHQRIGGAPISVGSALGRAAVQLWPLLLVNLLMGAAIFGGLMLLVLPGLFLAYKLLFAEFLLLFHGLTPIAALKASYQATRGRALQILPPLLFWAGLVILLSAGRALLFGSEAQPEPLAIVLQEGLAMLLTIFGWALLYRLYQLHIADQFNPPAAPPALDEG